MYYLDTILILIFYIFSTSQEQYDTDEMAKEFLFSFPNQIFTIGQQLAFQFKDKKMLLLIVTDIEGNCVSLTF